MPKSTGRPTYTVVRKKDGSYAVAVDLVGKPKLIVSGFGTKIAAEAWIEGEQGQSGITTASRPKTMP